LPQRGNGLQQIPTWRGRFEQGIAEDVVRVLNHELGHQYSPDHLSTQYYEALCRIGAKMFLLARQVQLA
jgi:hypothetical protein